MAIPAWSASSLDSFCTCPHRYFRVKIAKDTKDLPMSDEVLYGIKLHKALENAVNNGDALPLDVSHWQSIVDKIKAMPGQKFPEHKFAITRDFHPTEFFAKDAWSRGAADLVIINGKECAIIDYKTGKWKESDQLGLYAAYAFAHWPFLEKVTTMYIWMKAKRIDTKQYTQDDKAALWQRWLPKVRALEEAFEKNEWVQKPSGLCKKWCPVKDCKYCGV